VEKKRELSFPLLCDVDCREFLDTVALVTWRGNSTHHSTGGDMCDVEVLRATLIAVHVEYT